MGHRRHARDLLRHPPPTPHIVAVLSALVSPILILYFFAATLEIHAGEREGQTEEGGRD
jgi:hypothetical protein